MRTHTHTVTTKNKKKQIKVSSKFRWHNFVLDSWWFSLNSNSLHFCHSLPNAIPFNVTLHIIIIYFSACALPTAATRIQLRISKFYYIDWHNANHKNLLFASDVQALTHLLAHMTHTNTHIRFWDDEQQTRNTLLAHCNSEKRNCFFPANTELAARHVRWKHAKHTHTHTHLACDIVIYARKWSSRLVIPSNFQSILTQELNHMNVEKECAIIKM